MKNCGLHALYLLRDLKKDYCEIKQESWFMAVAAMIFPNQPW